MTPGVERLAGDPPSPYEVAYSFSRVVKAGQFALVGGTTSIGEDGVVLGGNPYEQTVDDVLGLGRVDGGAGARMADVIRTRAYVTDISRSDEIGRAHGAAFGDVRPLMTMVEVSALIDPRMFVEIEAVALLP